MPSLQRGVVPIYRQLVDQLRNDILTCRLIPGQRIPSITELQRSHGIARETAKRVLNLLEAQGLIRQQPGKGSFVADLRPMQPAWGLVFPFFSVQYEDLILLVAEQARQAGRTLHHLCDYNNYEEEMRLVQTMINDRYEAVIVIPTLDESRTLDFYEKLAPMGTRIVLLDHTMSSRDFPFVVQSYDLGVVRALTYLMWLKGGGVAFVENEVWPGRNMVLELMRETYLDLMRRERPGFEPLILPRARGVDAAALRQRGITAIFCCDDLSAIQVIGRLHEQGMEIPRDYNLVSYGNTDIGRYFTPPISSVDPRNAEMARIVAALLAPEPETPSESCQHVVHPELILRET
ncbi:MAG TPA: GntR family transcriptional regulator [Candidatus Hydrogenedentes bacterium]|nr:GntR family transcriptional regulator [Candidatus Hydrogenedentota bacterium]